MFQNVIAPQLGPLLCICTDKPFYIYATETNITVPKTTIDIIPITPKIARRIICTCDQVVPNPADIQNNLLNTVKLVAKHQPIEYNGMTFHVKELDPNEECLLLQEDTILEIICSWTRIIMDLELFPHMPILHIYVGACDMIWPFENMIDIHCSYFLKDMDFGNKIEEALKYQPCVLLLHDIHCLQDLWPYLLPDIAKLENQSVIMAAETYQDIDDIPGIWITRHITNSDNIKNKQIESLNKEYNIKLELDINKTELSEIKEIAWRHKIKQVDVEVDLVNPIIGLEYARLKLEKVILRPLQYKKLYQSLPTLSKGVLLYGLPGTGKTHLAKSFLKNMPHKIIKGPQILSKYVGETERNVRQLFQDAQSKAPFVLLFDEIDSLTPKRGHDSSGITDRIVNQFLTALDGSEVLKNVFVIGTTSQPHAIDPALLRPGRLDSHVECKCFDPSEFKEAVDALCDKYNIKIGHYEYVENCTFGDLESAFLKIYFDFVAENKHNNGIEEETIEFHSSLTESALREYEDCIAKFKGKGKRLSGRNKQTLS